PDTLHLTTTEAASIGTVYLIGEVIGALVFGKLSDNLGRRKLFVWTLAIFLILSSLRTSIGWRIAFLVGPALAFVIILVRRNLPESPRWLITHGRVREAEQAVHRIEDEAVRAGQHLERVPESEAIVIRPEKRYGYLALLRVTFRVYPRRAILGATLM